MPNEKITGSSGALICCVAHQCPQLRILLY